MHEVETQTIDVKEEKLRICRLLIFGMSGKNVWQIFNVEPPKVAEAWMNFLEAINIVGVLDQKTMYLIRIGIYSVTRDQGYVLV